MHSACLLIDSEYRSACRQERIDEIRKEIDELELQHPVDVEYSAQEQERGYKRGRKKITRLRKRYAVLSKREERFRAEHPQLDIA